MLWVVCLGASRLGKRPAGAKSLILKGFATLRVGKKKCFGFGFGSSNQSFLENPESLRDFLWKR